MKVGSRFLLDMQSGAHQMALAVEIPLPVNALTQNPSSLLLLVERAAAGETAAFEEIMIHSQHKVMAMTWRMLGNEADARDASQEVFLRVYKYLGSFKQDQDFFAWLYRITMNVCRDVLRQRKQHGSRLMLFAEDENKESLAVVAEQDDAEQLLIQTQRRELITKAIATLPFKERASIVLRDVEGLSTDEVARILKSSSTTVRSQISSARRKIRIYCEQYLNRKERVHSQ
jgi:RNA polymerase sigma-70 factor (ECF subfamily)